MRRAPIMENEAGIMSRISTLFFAFIILGGMAAYAQQQRDAARFSSKDSAAEKTKLVKATGTVKSYEAGKMIEVEAKGVPHRYDLSSADATYTISPDVA